MYPSHPFNITRPTHALGVPALKRAVRLLVNEILPLSAVLAVVGTIMLAVFFQQRRTVQYDLSSDAESVSRYSDTLRVAALPDHPPFSYLGDGSVPTGHNVELIYAIARTLGRNVTFETTELDTAYTGLERGTIDIIIGVDYSPTSSERFLLSRPVSSDLFTYFAVTGRTLPDHFFLRDGCRFATIRDANITDTVILPLSLGDCTTYYDTLAQAFDSVRRGDADFAIGNYLEGEHLIGMYDLDIEAVGGKILENTVHFAVHRDNTALMDDINAALVEQLQNGTLGALEKKWIHDFQPNISVRSLFQQNRELFLLIGIVIVLTVVVLFIIYRLYVHARERRMLETNPLTGLPNQLSFCEQALRLVRDNPTTAFTVVRTDIDHFRIYNDSYGSESGDQLLRGIGARLKDIAAEQKELAVGYAGADHFLLCLPTERCNPEAMLLRIDEVLHAVVPDYTFSARLGFSDVPNTASDISPHCDNALLALRSVKNRYERHWAWYDRSMRNSSIEEREINATMVNALQSGEFVPYFQPQCNFRTGTTSGAEVLVRWNHPQRGLLSPSKFLPVFEKNGFIYELDKYIWRQACACLSRWDGLGLHLPSVSINISRRDIYHSDFVDTLIAISDEFHIDRDRLHLEITESAYIENPKLLINAVNALSANGFLVEMDDFGSGYSSLTLLKDLTIDLVKLDMDFLRNGDTAGKSSNILSSVIRLAHQIELPVIAEGVETEDQARFLSSIGCSYMQGYYFSKPLCDSDFEAYLLEHSR